MGQATVVLPTAVASVPTAASGNLKTFVNQIARVANQAMTGNISATLQVTLVPDDTTSVFNDTRIGPWTTISMAPLTAHAADLLPYVYFDTPVRGMATINHARTPYTDCTYLVSLIGT